MRHIWVALAILSIGVSIVAVQPRPAAATDQSKNLIKNGLFERWVTWDDVIVGENWAPWVISGAPKFGRHGHEPGQQIMSERSSFVAGLYQEIFNAKPGAQYYGYVGSASLYWGNTEGKFEEVGRTVGIDPTGGTDPRSPKIVWGNTTWTNKRWDFKDDPNAHAAKVLAIAQGPKITFFIKVTFNRGDNLAQAWLTDAAVILDTETPSGNPTPIPTPGTAQVWNATTPGPSPAAPASQPTPAPATAPQPAAASPAGLAAGPRAAGQPDFPLLSGGQVAGRFYTQTAKDGQGYAVANAGTDRDGRTTRWWSEFTRLGGLDSLGYPISRPFVGTDGFPYQGFQRGILQWRPGEDRAVLANALDWLSDAGRDDWARERALPKPIKDDGSGGDYAKAVQTRLSWLTEPAIAKRFREGPDPVGAPQWTQDDSIGLYGLPASQPERIGPFIIQRFQRVAFQYWVEDAAGAPPKGSVVPVLAGDLLAEAGLIPADARRSELPPS